MSLGLLILLLLVIIGFGFAKFAKAFLEDKNDEEERYPSKPAILKNKHRQVFGENGKFARPDLQFVIRLVMEIGIGIALLVALFNICQELKDIGHYINCISYRIDDLVKTTRRLK